MDLKEGQEVFIRAKVLGSHGRKVRVQLAHTGGILMGQLAKHEATAAPAVSEAPQETTPILDFQETTPILD